MDRDRDRYRDIDMETQRGTEIETFDIHSHTFRIFDTNELKILFQNQK